MYICEYMKTHQIYQPLKVQQCSASLWTRQWSAKYMVLYCTEDMEHCIWSPVVSFSAHTPFFLLSFFAFFSNSLAHTSLLDPRNIWRKVLKSLSLLPQRMSMTLPICWMLPGCSLTVAASNSFMNPPAASSNLLQSPVSISTRSWSFSRRETKASLFQGLMG